MRMVLYLAARAKIIGKHQDAGGELMFGAYVFGRGNMRVGWEGGLGVIKHPEWNAQESPELEVLLNVYVGWNLEYTADVKLWLALIGALLVEIVVYAAS